MDVSEHGTPTQDLAAYRRCLGQFGTGIAVITATVDGEQIGMTSNSFASVSLDPALVLWSIRRASTSFEKFMSCNAFAVNILATDQIDLSQRFARTSQEKFVDVDWSPGMHGSPVLGGALATFECRTERNIEGGDHVIMIGLVDRWTRRDNKDALLFVQGRYAAPIEHPMSLVPARFDNPVAANDLGIESLASLLVRAYGALSSTLAAARQIEGLSLIEASLMRGVRSFPGSTLGEVLPRLLLGVNASEDVVNDLCQRGWLRSDTDRRLWLTEEGESRFVAVLTRARQLERRELAGLPKEELQATRDVLAKIVAR